ICALGVFAKTNSNRDCGDSRIHWGREQANAGTGQRTILYGNCAISKNRDDEHAVRIAGCPPTTMSTLLPLIRTLLPWPRMLKMLLLGSPQLLAVRLGLYSGNLPKWKRYRSPEFDRSHFRPSLWQRMSQVFAAWRK
ncbi:MAG: hypothetical protein V3V80_02015, partial [Dehalococcoidia bacterium]